MVVNGYLSYHNGFVSIPNKEIMKKFENLLPWCLDIAFNEDYSRARKDNAAENLNIIRHICLNMLKQEKSCKMGLKGKRKKCGWDLNYRLKVLDMLIGETETNKKNVCLPCVVNIFLLYILKVYVILLKGGGGIYMLFRTRMDIQEIIRNNRINCADNIGFTPLMWACVNHENILVDRLLELGASIDAENIDGDTALMYACDTENEYAVKRLLEYGADVNIQNNYGNTPLIYACEKGNIVIVQILLEKGANLNIQNEGGNTALMYACAKGDYPIVHLLISKNANVSIENSTGNTAVECAKLRGKREVIQLLRENVCNSPELIR